MPNLTKIPVAGARVDTEANFESKKRELNAGELVVTSDTHKLVAMYDDNGNGVQVANLDDVQDATAAAIDELIESDGTSVTGITVGESVQQYDYEHLDHKLDKTAIAPLFDSSQSYAVGDCVIHDGQLYKCRTAGSGAWNAARWTLSSVVDVAASADALDEAVTELKGDLSELDNAVFEWKTKTQTTNITGTNIQGSTHIIDVNIAQGMAYTIKVDDPDGIINPNSSNIKNISVYYANSNNERTSLGTLRIGEVYSFVANENISYFTGYKTSNSVTPPGNLVVTCQYKTADSPDSLQKRMEIAEDEIVELQAPVTGTMRKSQNLFDAEHFTEGSYINAMGAENVNASYGHTDYIPVNAGDVVWFNCGNARTICAYNDSKIVVAASGSNTAVASGEYTVPNGIAYIILSFELTHIPQYPVVNTGVALIAYEPFGKWYIKDEALPEIEIESAAQVSSLLGSTSATIESASLASGNLLALTDAPWFIKKNQGITAIVKFGSFTKLSVGKGYNNYRGKWIEIDSANIVPYASDGTTATAGTAIPHGLTISNFLQVSMYVANDGKCRISINTLSGTFSTEIDYLYEWNYAPFVIGEQVMTDVKLSYSCADLRCPLWLFGDSYMGIAVNRIGGQLKNLGYFNYLIDAIAGGRAVDSGTPGKSASNDLERMLEFATPKFIIWTLGMNGGKAMNITYIPSLITLCESKNIELILYMPPSVPTIDHTDLNTFIASTGLRYINGNNAVGATSQGEWYTGYLSNDEVHPSSLGAKALAMRFIIDAPELMQYGYSTGTVDGEIDGDEH